MRACIAQIEEKIGTDKFSYFMSMDNGMTGRLEVTVYKGSAQSCTGEGEVAWSKAQSGAYPASDWETFIGMVRAAIE